MQGLPGQGIDVDLLRLVASTALQKQLDTIVGPKTLVLTPGLAGPLGLVTEVGLLKNNHAVSRMFWLEPGALQQAERNVVYLCRPEVKWMRLIAAPTPSRYLLATGPPSTCEGGYKPFNRTGLSNNSSPFLKASFETTSGFVSEAALFNLSAPPSTRCVRLHGHASSGSPSQRDRNVQEATTGMAN
ncbi:hypothetical protein JCM8097_000001 [Rhodosporidiobolus ruineniae]